MMIASRFSQQKVFPKGTAVLHRASSLGNKPGMRDKIWDRPRGRQVWSLGRDSLLYRYAELALRAGEGGRDAKRAKVVQEARLLAGLRLRLMTSLRERRHNISRNRASSLRF